MSLSLRLGNMEKSGMKILVTGTNGFIGSYLCQRLSQANKVVGVTRRDNSSGNLTLEALPDFRWHKADLAEGLSMSDDIDMIVHAAARTPAPKVTIADYVSSNIITTQNLIEFAVQKKVKSFVYLSAISVYGRIDSTIVDEETSIIEPTPYGMTKYIAELLLREKADAVPSIILRLPLVVDAGMKSGWLFRTYERLLKGEPVRIYNGDSPYNMVSISDVYDLVSRSLNYNLAGSSVFTISCKDFVPIRQIVNTMRQYTRSKSKISEAFTAKKGFTISTEKARRILGFRPKSASEILTEFLEEMNASNGGDG